MKHQKIEILLATIEDGITTANSNHPMKNLTLLNCLRNIRKQVNRLGEASRIQTLSNQVGVYMTPNYFVWGSFWQGLNSLLETNGFKPVCIPNLIVNNVGDGSKILPIESKDETLSTHISVNWHFMEQSHKYEFVAYITE